MFIRIICNPVSGGGLGSRACAAVRAALEAKNVPHEITLTNGPGDGAALAYEAKEKGADRILVISGDGTLAGAASGAVRAGLPMGIIPAGTGNDFVKSVGIPLRTEQALDCFLNCPPRPTDVLRINGRLALNVAGTGFDVMVLTYAEKVKKYVKGLLPYLYGVVQTIFHYRPVRLTYRADEGDEITREVLVIGAANGRFYGGGIPIAPEAKADDGLIDFVLVNGMSKPRMLRALPGLLKGKVLSFPETEFARIRKLTIRGEGLVINIDGEMIPMDAAGIEALPGALMLCRP